MDTLLPAAHFIAYWVHPDRSSVRLNATLLWPSSAEALERNFKGVLRSLFYHSTPYYSSPTLWVRDDENQASSAVCSITNHLGSQFQFVSEIRTIGYSIRQSYHQAF